MNPFALDGSSCSSEYLSAQKDIKQTSDYNIIWQFPWHGRNVLRPRPTVVRAGALSTNDASRALKKRVAQDHRSTSTSLLAENRCAVVELVAQAATSFWAPKSACSLFGAWAVWRRFIIEPLDFCLMRHRCWHQGPKRSFGFVVGWSGALRIRWRQRFRVSLIRVVMRLI